MCRNTINVSWQGEVFDCDFNQMLKMHWSRDGGSQGLHLWEGDPAQVENRQILTGDHCFGCTAGAGSSCGGALENSRAVATVPRRRDRSACGAFPTPRLSGAAQRFLGAMRPQTSVSAVSMFRSRPTSTCVPA